MIIVRPKKVKLPEDIISFFDEHGISLTAEAWRSPGEENSAVKQAVLSLDGSRNTLREYIDGSKIIEAGFEVRLRVRADSLKDRLDAAEFFRKVSSAVSDNAGESFTLSESSGMTKSAIYENGDEEFRASYKIKYKE